MTNATSENAWRLVDRAIIRLAGSEARPFLNGLVTRNIDRSTPTAPLWTGLLSPQGKALFDFLVWADGPEDLLIDCEAAAAEALIRRLTLYRLRRPVSIARDEELAVCWSLTEPATGAPADPRLPALGHRWIAPVASAPAADGSALWRAHRHAAGVPEGLDELGSDKTLWLEANAAELNGVDFDKGCYVGQENTARMHYRSKVNRRLTFVPLAASDPARQRAVWPDEGRALDFLRVEDMNGLPLPDWQSAAIADTAGR